MSLKNYDNKALEAAVSRLGKAVKARHLSQAKRIVDDWIDHLDTLPYSHSAIRLTSLCAWAIDLHGPYTEQVEKAVLQFKQLPPDKLTLGDLSALGVAQALVEYHQEKYADARAHFEQATVDAERVGDAELLTISLYYLGRTLFKLTNYESALERIREAKRRDLTAGNQARAASMQLDVGWLNFLLGDIKEAQQKLHEAQAILSGQSDAFVDLGNALSFQGRLCREDAQYQNALNCYARAIEAYERYDPSYRNVARCRRNIAVIYRIMTRDLLDLNRKEIPQDKQPEIDAQIKELRTRAFAELEQAREIYNFDAGRYHHGLGIVHITLALLHFDAAELDQAAAEAQHAYEYGSVKGDYIVMAEARVIQSGLELEGYRGVINARRALRLANEAIHLGEQTDRHRRLLARAYICKGYALLESPHYDVAGAGRCCEAAKSCLVPEDRDYLRDMLDALESKIASKGPIASFNIQLTHNDVVGLSLIEIIAKVEERILRYHYELSGRSIPKAAKALTSGDRKVKHAVSFFKITEGCLKNLAAEGVDAGVLEKLAGLKNQVVHGRATFEALLREKIGDDLEKIIKLIREHVTMSICP
jgi:tetratricopeptide (TPR) repeat protein